MESSFEKLEGNTVKLTVTHSAEEVEAAIADAYGMVARKVKLPGFRPGKAPRPLLDAQVGRDYVLGEALESLVESSYPRAIDAQRLHPLDRPDTGTLDGLVEGEPYTYTADVEVRPELTLSSLDTVTASVPPSETTDEEVEAQIDYLRDRFATLAPVEDRGIADADYALLSFTGTVDGEPAEDLNVDKYLYEVGRGIMPPQFDEGLVGAKSGEIVHIEFPVPDTAANPEYVGKIAAFDVEVFEIKVKQPAVADDAFATEVGGFDTIEELRTDIRTRLNESKATAHPRLVERAAISALVERLEGDVPERMVTSRAASMTEEFFDSLRDQGMSVEDYEQATGLTAPDIQADIAVEAGRRVRDDLALEALFRQAKLEVLDDELDREIEKLAASDKTSAAAMRERLIDSGVIGYVRDQLIHRHAVRWLMDHVDVVEEKPGEPAAKPKKAAAKKTTKKEAAATGAVEGTDKPKKATRAKKAAAETTDAAKEE